MSSDLRMSNTGKHVLKDGTVVDGNLVSIYKFANMHKMTPQDVYGMRLRGSLPTDLIVDIRKPDGKFQPMIKVKEAEAFFATKTEVKDTKAVARVVQNPAMVVDAVIDLIEKSNKRLAKKVREWWIQENAGTPEGK